MFSPLDILYIVLAFCALWFTAAIFWLIYQVASILKNVNNTFTLIQEAIDKIEEGVNAMREKVEKASSGIPLIVNGVKSIIEFAVDKKKNSKD